MFLGEASPLVAPAMRLSVEHRFVDTAGAAIIRGYEYASLSENYQELLAHHWHPPNPPWPHLHIRTRLTGRSHPLTGAHLPTGQLGWNEVTSLLAELTS